MLGAAMLLGIGLSGFSNAADANTLNQLQESNAAKIIGACRQMEDKEKRLQCYDEAALKLLPPRYSGRLGYITEPFKLNGPHRLRFRSYGAIFVLYVRDEDGNVLQNLHIGGGGEDTYTIKSAGTYSLKIHGSAAWSIWLEPVNKKQQEQKNSIH